MKRLLTILSVLPALALAGTIVDQGAPGVQGPWPVRVQGAVVITLADGGSALVTTGSVAVVGADGGSPLVATYDAQCMGTAPDGGALHTNVSVGTSATNVPAAQVPGRLYTEICNSLQNTGNPTLKCRADGTAPVMAVTNPGDVLGVGDCRKYAVKANVVVQCIADAASTNALTYDCVPAP